MKTHITIILLLFFVVNFAYGQKTINSKRSVNTNSLQKVNSISGNNRTIIPLNPQKNNNISTLNLTVLIQGFYNGSSMVSVNPIVVTVELHDATTYEGMESQIGTLTSSGIGSFTFNSVVDGVPYYIVIKSPNTVETWSTTPVSFISGVLNYDFTTSAAQAYGNNLKLVGSKYCIISGDLNQDGLVDISDMMEIDNDIANHVTGISVSDVNGDGLIDLNDLIIVDNNNINYLSEETPPGTPPEYINYSGQIYHTVLIGTQYWLKENLNVGTMVPGSQSQSNNGIIEKYCYNNLLANCNIYGGLYQWNETMQYSSSVGKVQGICPVGWHIPSINEFSTLATSVSGNSNSLKSVGQGVDIGAGTNSSGFSVLMTGSRYYPTGTFSDLGGESYFWSSSISGLTNASYMDISGYIPDIYQYTVNQDYGFSIRCVKDGWFLLLAPNGGESWQVGSTQNITWTSSNIANAKIELSTDNGNNWSTIIGSTPASIHSYSWTIPNSPSSLCKIKLSDASDSTVKSISTTPFTIWTPTITLSSPNGGEIWKVGDIDTIKWTSTNVANVRIDYSTDTGTNWTTLIASTNSSIGYFAWTVPFTPSVNCKIRIVDLVDTTINAVSINNFTISNPPCPGLATVVYGSQTYNTVLIGNQCWLKENLNIGSFLNSLQEQTNNAVIEKYCYNNNPANCTTYGGLYEWAEAVQYQNGATNLASPNPAFYGHIQGICPSGWHIPDTSDYNVLSNTVHNDANSLKAVGQGAFSGAGTNLSGFSALLAGTRFSDGSFASLTLYTFLLTPNEANNVNIYYADLGTDFDTVFVGSNSKQYGRSIRCIKDGSVSLQSPNGGENWQAGSNHNITWTSTYFTNVKIDFSTDNGSTWSTVIASTPSSAGSYNWTIPNSPSTLCKVRVSDAIDTTIMSIITSVFTISPAPAITISSPIGGEVWNVTEVHSITWTSTSVLTVKIDYTTDEGSTWIPVFSVPASSGSYDWTVPNTPGQCKVRISDEGNSILNSISTNDFTIANP